MNTLDAALGGMRALAQWFLWRLVWDAAEEKYLKTPCAVDGSVFCIDASMPQNWGTYEQIAARAVALNMASDLSVRYAIGFWLTESCGYWFFDLDRVGDGTGAMTPDAQARLSAFPGALLEWSSSGKGIHIIGRTLGSAPAHRSRATRECGLPYELYTEGRGIAFGLSGQASGSADTFHDVAVNALVNELFPPREKNEGRRNEWRGPDDDDELIRRALQAKRSAESVFGGKASFADLWHGNVEKDSSADMALASHLAFWTGCDEERIERLMWKSGLVREKWKTHRTYLRELTIRNACTNCTNVYQEPVRPALPATPAKRVRSATELMRQEFKPVQWAIQGILPEGVTILSGDPKIGKSWLVYQMCLAVATGHPLWSGRAGDVVGDALMLALEDTDRRLQRRLKELLPAYGGVVPPRLHLATEWSRAEEGVADLAAWLREHPECRIVVIDTLSAFRDNDPGRKSAYAHDYAAGEMLKPLAREFNCAIVLVMHNRKQSAGDVMHKVSGTQGMTGSVDNVLVLERERGGMDAALHVDGRDIEEPVELAMKFEEARWRSIGDVADVRRTKERTAVLQALLTLGGVGSAREIHEAIAGPESLNAVRMRLSRMVRAGELRNDGGIYTHLLKAGSSEQPAAPPTKITA